MSIGFGKQSMWWVMVIDMEMPINVVPQARDQEQSWVMRKPHSEESKMLIKPVVRRTR